MQWELFLPTAKSQARGFLSSSILLSLKSGGVCLLNNLQCHTCMLGPLVILNSTLSFSFQFGLAIGSNAQQPLLLKK